MHRISGEPDQRLNFGLVSRPQTGRAFAFGRKESRASGIKDWSSWLATGGGTDAGGLAPMDHRTGAPEREREDAGQQSNRLPWPSGSRLKMGSTILRFVSRQHHVHAIVSSPGIGRAVTRRGWRHQAAQIPALHRALTTGLSGQTHAFPRTSLLFRRDRSSSQGRFLSGEGRKDQCFPLSNIS